MSLLVRFGFIAAICPAFVVAAAVASAQTPAAPPADPTVDGFVAESPIVAGNVVRAKEKALADVRRQAVERAFIQLTTESGAAAGDPIVASVKATVAKTPQTFVSSYRILEESDSDGFVRVRALVDVDEAALRARWKAARGDTAPGPGRALAVFVSGPADALGAVQAALAVAGAKADVQPAPMGDGAASVGKDGRPALLVTVAAQDEGVVRGTSSSSVSCRVGVRLVAGGDPGTEKISDARAFDPAPSAARAACLARGANESVPAALAELGQLSGPNGDGRPVFIALDVVEPAALAPALRALRRVGAVWSTELRRVRLGLVEVRVVTRLSPDQLLVAFRKQLGPSFVLTPGASRPDKVEAQLRFAPPSEPVAPAPATPPAAPPGAQ